MAKVLSRLDILLHANTANYRRDIKQATDGTKRQLKSVAEQAKIANQQMSQSAKREFTTIANYGSQLKHQLGATFTALGTMGLAQNIVQTADRMQDLASKVRINTQSTEEYMAVLHDLRKISTDYWTAIDGITDLYASSKRALDSLGASQREVLDFTRNITMAMSIGGGSAQAQEAALIQLGQAMNMGMLRGQEFNSVSAQAPVIIDLLTESLKVSRGELRQMAKEGKITSQVMKDAVLGGYDKLQNIINQMPTTFAQGLQNVKSQYDFLVDDIMNQNSLISQNLANAALWVADNFRTLVTAGAVVGTVWAANAVANSALMASMLGMAGSMAVATKASVAHAFSQQHLGNVMMTVLAGHTPLQIAMYRYAQSAKTAMTSTIAFARSLPVKIKSLKTSTASLLANAKATLSLATAQKVAINSSILLGRGIVGIGTVFTSLGRIIMAHPIITLVGVIGAVIARTEGLEGTIKSLGDAFSVAGLLAVDFIGGVVDGLGMAWTATANYFDKLMGGSANATGFAQTAFGGFFAGTEKGFVGVGQIIARTFDLGGATVVWFVNFAGKNIRALGTAVSNVFKGVGNFVISVFEKLTHGIIDEINDLIKGFNLIKEFFGGSTIPLIGKKSFGRFEYGTPDFGGVGDIASYNQHGLENAWVNQYKELTNASNQASNANLGLAGSMADVASAGEKAGGGAKKLADSNKLAKKNADEAAKALKELVDSYNSQMAEWERAWWEMGTPFISALSKIEFEITSLSGKFHIASDDMKNNLRKLAREMDTAKANFELFGTHTDAIRQMELLSSKGSKYLEMAYDLQDTGNALHLAGDEQKKQILITMANLEVATKAWEIQDKILENQKELATLGMPDGIARELLLVEQERADTLEQYNYLLKDGHTEQFALVEQQANALAEQQKQIVITKQYNDLVQSLKSEEEKRLDTLKEQLAILTEHQRLTGADIGKQRSQLLTNALGLPKQELNPFEQLDQENNNRLAVLDSFIQTQQQLYQDNQDELARIEQEGAIARLAIDTQYATAKNELIFSSYENGIGQVGNMMKNAFGEQSRAYQVMFAMQKGVAITQASLALWQNVSQAMAKGFPANVPLIAQAMAQGMGIIANIKAIKNTVVGQAHDGIMSVPKSGTWNLEKGERVLPRHTAQNLDRTLANLQDKRQSETKIIINNYTSEKASVEQMPNGDMMVTIGKMMQQVARHEVAEHHRRSKRQGWG